MDNHSSPSISRKWKGSEIQTSLETKQELGKLAIDLRKCSTKSEAILWKHLRCRQLDGYKFRRQHPFGPFILDFFCAEKRLVIEIDGPVHEQQRERDQERQTLIEGTGYTVLRFSADQVEKDITTVILTLHNWLSIFPSPSGEGTEG